MALHPNNWVLIAANTIAQISQIPITVEHRSNSCLHKASMSAAECNTKPGVADYLSYLRLGQRFPEARKHHPNAGRHA